MMFCNKTLNKINGSKDMLQVRSSIYSLSNVVLLYLKEAFLSFISLRPRQGSIIGKLYCRIRYEQWLGRQQDQAIFACVLLDSLHPPFHLSPIFSQTQALCLLSIVNDNKNQACVASTFVHRILFKVIPVQIKWSFIAPVKKGEPVLDSTQSQDTHLLQK